MSTENIIYIGMKPIMNYCIAIVQSLQEKGGVVTVKARGRAICTAVDAVEVTRTRFLNNLTIEDIEIGTEELESADGGMRNVSTITIVLSKGAGAHRDIKK
jgi:DNA-binding protein